MFKMKYLIIAGEDFFFNLRNILGVFPYLTWRPIQPLHLYFDKFKNRVGRVFFFPVDFDAYFRLGKVKVKEPHRPAGLEPPAWARRRKKTSSMFSILSRNVLF